MKPPRFARHARIPFEQYVLPKWNGSPIRYLELGVYEGASARWMFEHVLTHPESKADLVDPWIPYIADPSHVYSIERIEQAYQKALELTGLYPGRCVVSRTTSEEFLERAEKHKWRFDLVYQDGSHQEYDVYADGIQLMRLVNDGAWIIFDDYSEPGVRKGVERFAESVGHLVDDVYTTKDQRCFEVKEAS